MKHLKNICRIVRAYSLFGLFCIRYVFTKDYWGKLASEYMKRKLMSKIVESVDEEDYIKRDNHLDIRPHYVGTILPYEQRKQQSEAQIVEDAKQLLESPHETQKTEPASTQHPDSIKREPWERAGVIYIDPETTPESMVFGVQMGRWTVKRRKIPVSFTVQDGKDGPIISCK